MANAGYTISSAGCTPEPSDTAGIAPGFTTTIPQVFRWLRSHFALGYLTAELNLHD